MFYDRLFGRHIRCYFFFFPHFSLTAAVAADDGVIKGHQRIHSNLPDSLSPSL